MSSSGFFLFLFFFSSHLFSSSFSLSFSFSFSFSISFLLSLSFFLFPHSSSFLFLSLSFSFSFSPPLQSYIPPYTTITLMGLWACLCRNDSFWLRFFFFFLFLFLSLFHYLPLPSFHPFSDLLSPSPSLLCPPLFSLSPKRNRKRKIRRIKKKSKNKTSLDH